MSPTFLANTKLSELTRDKSAGEPVNVHVVEHVHEPVPDFERMQMIIDGKIAISNSAAKPEPSTNDAERGN